MGHPHHPIQRKRAREFGSILRPFIKLNSHLYWLAHRVQRSAGGFGQLFAEASPAQHLVSFEALSASFATLTAGICSTA
jgi:hypothetical protein